MFRNLLSGSEEHLAALVIKGGGDPEKSPALLHSLGRLVELIGSKVYGKFEVEAREGLDRRDPEDWPMLLLLPSPLASESGREDTEFFGRGVATWTSDRPDVPAGIKNAH